MDERIKSLVKQSSKIFSDRQSLLDLWQEISYNFYPERADFTVKRYLGEEFNEQNMTSYPMLARRDLGNSFGSMLRPKHLPWFKMSTTREDRHDHAAKLWLEYATQVQRRATYDRKAQFSKATKEGDHDFAAFGQCVLEVEVNRNDPRLIYQCWHLRDVAWVDDSYGAPERIDRTWMPTVSMVMRMFPADKIDQKVKNAYAKDPNTKIKLLRVVMKADLYDKEKKQRHGWMSIWIDQTNSSLLEEVNIPSNPYVLPRWQTVSGSQYAYSPATVLALPDARLIQSMTRVLLEVGEKAVDPPMLAVQEAIRSDVSLYAGGITWVDEEYDERLGEVLRPIRQDRTNFGYGIDLRRDTQNMITEAFYLNKMSLPPTGGPEMTAYEVGQRVQEYIRQALPLFEPMESEYNGALCERTFDVLMLNGAFGPVEDIPESLSGADIEFKFESPLHEAIEQQKGQKFHEAGDLLARAAEIDPSVASNVDINTAFRDAFSGIGAPESWMTDENAAADIRAADAEAQAEAQRVEMAQQAGVAGQEVAGAEEAAARAEQMSRAAS